MIASFVTIGTYDMPQGEIGYEVNNANFSVLYQASTTMGAAISRKVGANGAFDTCELQLSSDNTAQQCLQKYGCTQDYASLAGVQNLYYS